MKYYECNMTFLDPAKLDRRRKRMMTVERVDHIREDFLERRGKHSLWTNHNMQWYEERWKFAFPLSPLHMWNTRIKYEHLRMVYGHKHEPEYSYFYTFRFEAGDSLDADSVLKAGVSKNLKGVRQRLKQHIAVARKHDYEFAGPVLLLPVNPNECLQFIEESIFGSLPKKEWCVNLGFEWYFECPETCKILRDWYISACYVYHKNKKIYDQ